MDLFGFDKQFNLLPYDGEVYYYGSVIGSRDSSRYFDELLRTIAWQHDELIIYGKKIVTERKMAWYGDNECCHSYSNTTKKAMSWTKPLLALKSLVEEQTQSRFNSCLLNLYHHGNEGLGWHCDDERELDYQPIIASLSLGAERKFALKHKRSKETVSLVLEHGSLLVMRGSTQDHWQHSLPKTVKEKEPRINLTFRTIYSENQLNNL